MCRSALRPCPERCFESAGPEKTLVAAEQDQDRIQRHRDAYRGWQARVDAGRVFCIDETGSTIAMTRKYARAPCGDRVEGRVPRNRGNVSTSIGALMLDGLVAILTVEVGTSGDVFLAYVQQVLGPQLRHGDSVVMDNLAAHKDERVRSAIKATGARAVYQPPDSPDLTPIELAWAWLKDFLRTAEARTRDALDRMVGWAIDMISTKDAKGWFTLIGSCLLQGLDLLSCLYTTCSADCLIIRRSGCTS